jgi:hypothetical protein
MRPHKVCFVIASTHMLAGALVGIRARTSRQALVAGVTSHFLMDAIPHSDYEIGDLLGLALVADLLTGAAITTALTVDSPRLWVGAFGGIIPDVLNAVEDRLGLKLVGHLHSLAHSRKHLPASVGVPTQAALAALLAYGLYRRPKRARAFFLGRTS